VKVSYSLNFAFALGELLPARGSLLMFSNRLQHEEWACYPRADATIVSASICPIDHDNCPHVACLTYTYRVENDDYSGLYAMSFSTRVGALEFVKDYRDCTLVARFRPECPQESCLFVPDYTDMPEGDAARIVSAFSGQA
jgi:hypothetical protein